MNIKYVKKQTFNGHFDAYNDEVHQSVDKQIDDYNCCLALISCFWKKVGQADLLVGQAVFWWLPVRGQVFV